MSNDILNLKCSFDPIFQDLANFLLNEHGDSNFLFYKFNENNIRNNWEKIWQKSIATFLANEINATVRDVTGPIRASPNYVSFKG